MGAYKYPTCPILMVDDEPSWLRSMSLMLERLGGIDHVETCDDSREVMARLSQKEYSLVLLDNVMPHFTGMELLFQIMEEYPGLPVIILTGLSQIEDAVHCIKAGAYDYFVKTMEDERLVTGIQRALHYGEVSRENRKLRDSLSGRELEHPEAFSSMASNSEKLLSLFNYVEAIAPSRHPVLITGESGTGKKLLAKALHQISSPQGPWVVATVAGMRDEQFGEALFGQVATLPGGGEQSQPGLIEKARGGTLVLDDIGSLSAVNQAVLLQLLQSGSYTIPGSARERRSHTRLVLVCNQDLRALQADGHFRKDLYFRLRTHHVHLPPLRDRVEDLPLLLNEYLNQAARELSKARPTPPPELYTLLASYHFPGNVSELRAMVYDAVTLHQGRKLSMEAFKRAMGLPTNGREDVPLSDDGTDLPSVSFGDQLPTIKGAVHQLVEEAMGRANGNQGIAAGILGISRPALNKRLKKMDTEEE